MHTGFYTIASGMLTKEKEIDTIGNNLLNAQTPGFRAERVITSSFEMSLLKRFENGTEQVLGDGVASPIAIVSESVSNFSNGIIQTTDRSLDFALNGEGFFNIQGQDGNTYLTRNGQFMVDEQGYLVLPGMGRVLGKAGPIQVGSDAIQVTPQGDILNAAGAVVGTLQITKPAENTTLQKMENGAFTAPQGVVNATPEVYQGVIETSNVNMNQEMATLIEAQRMFQSYSSALQMIDNIDRKAVSQIAAIQ